MKIYVKSNADVEDFDIFDLFDTCEVIYMDDIWEYTHQHIYGVSVFSNSAIQDENLLKLPQKKKDAVSDPDTLLRLAGLGYQDFNPAQIATLGMLYRNRHFTSSKNAVRGFLP